MVLAVASAIVALVLGGYGLHKISFERGYVHGYEDATPPVKVEVDLDD
ncbi:MAG: hypothetical protein AB9880_00035 [Christensenellales bacterium]